MIAAGVLDASVFIANSTGRLLDESAVPEEVATTVITVAELTAGVLAAGSAEVRSRRLATPDAVADVMALPSMRTLRGCGRGCGSIAPKRDAGWNQRFVDRRDRRLARAAGHHPGRRLRGPRRGEWIHRDSGLTAAVRSPSRA